MYHETVSLSQMQDHAVLKDDEVSPLVRRPPPAPPAPPPTPAAASRWAVAAGPSLPAARLKRCGYPPPAHLQLRFKIITIIVQIITIMANNSINWARIDTVSALVQSTLASLALLQLA